MDEKKDNKKLDPQKIKRDLKKEIKFELYTEVKIHEDIKRDLFYDKEIISILSELIKVLNQEISLDTYRTAALFVPLVYPKVKKKASSINNKLCKIAIAIERYKSSKLNEEMYTEEISLLEEDWQMIINDLETYKEELMYERDANIEKEQELRPNAIKYRRIISALKYKWPIPEELEDTLIEYLRAKQKSDKDINKIREIIRQHNQTIRFPNFRISDTVILMLEKKYEPIPLNTNLELERRLKGDIEYYKQYFIDGDESPDILPDKNDIDDEKLEYIYIRLLNILVDIINDACEEMKQYETYDDENYRKLIIADYNNAVNKYNRLLEKYRNEIIREKGMEKSCPENIEEQEEDKSKATLLFLRKPQSERIYIMDDMKYIPEENYERIIKLLAGLRNDNLPEINYGGFVGHDKIDDYEELKDNPVRIIYRNLGNDEYLILGAFVKKENNAFRKVEECAKRYRYVTEKRKEELRESSEDDYADILKYLDENKRKGNR